MTNSDDTKPGEKVINVLRPEDLQYIDDTQGKRTDDAGQAPKPREYKLLEDEFNLTVYDQTEFDAVPEPDEDEELIHVIEKSAYEAALAELELAKQRNAFRRKLYLKAKGEKKALEKELAEYKESLSLTLEAQVVTGRELTQAREEIERLNAEITAHKQANENLSDECASLHKNLGTRKTLEALLGENGQICEMYDDIEARDTLIEKCAEVLFYYSTSSKNNRASGLLNEIQKFKEDEK